MMCHHCSQLPTESGYHPWSAIPHFMAVAPLLGLAPTPPTPSRLLLFMLGSPHLPCCPSVSLWSDSTARPPLGISLRTLCGFLCTRLSPGLLPCAHLHLSPLLKWGILILPQINLTQVSDGPNDDSQAYYF